MPECFADGLLRVLRALHEVLRGAAGTDAYGQYLDHQRRHHPDAPALSRAAFFREQLAARWEGVRRCC